MISYHGEEAEPHLPGPDLPAGGTEPVDDDLGEAGGTTG